MRSAWAVPKNKARQIRRIQESLICGQCPFSDGHANVRSVVSSLHSPPVIPNRGAMRLIGLAVVFTLTLVLEPLAAEAQPAWKMYRIGVLDTLPMAQNGANLDAFRQGMRELALEDLVDVGGGAELDLLRLPRLN